ncbi:MAG: DEAD/DEAH box helicase [Leptothrix sp. (in: b-proteobacteria)]
MSAFEQLHPALQYHVVNTMGWSTLRPTQLAAIEPIQRGDHCLLLAPTAGGKTEAAILPVLSRMLIEDWPASSVLYICPIKALLNNLEVRLTQYAAMVGRTVEVWHGDVSQSRKRKALRERPDFLLTTPESLEGMLISPRIDRQAWLGQIRAVVVDELHAFAADDRGWHLRSILNRLGRYTPQPIQRIGLSATVSNPEELLAWLASTGPRTVVGQASVSTDAEVTIDHVSSIENAATVIDRLHRGQKRLVFCDSRATAEQLGSALRGLGVRAFVSHASLSQSERKLAETAFAEEKDCVIVATSTLELGIDVGDLDRVIQIDAPSTVSSFLQRMGRTGRRAGAQRNCLFLTTSDDALLLALGVTQCWSEAWVERAYPPGEPWTLVAQQALVSILERGQATVAELVAVLVDSFPELSGSDVELLCQHLLDRDFLSKDGDLLQVGPATEREYGRSHYRELLASFSGSPQLTGRFGSAEIGYIDPSVVSGEQGARLILLAGRSWKVTDIEWGKKIVWLEPAREGGSARWMGGGRSMSRDIAQGIKKVLLDGPKPTVLLSRRASTRFEELRDEIPASSDDVGVTRQATGLTRWWTFAGTLENRVAAKRLVAKAVVKKSDALGVTLQSPPPDLQWASVQHEPVKLSAKELASEAEGMKFSTLLPSALGERLVMSRSYGIKQEEADDATSEG